MSEPWAKIIADSISPMGSRLTSIEVNFHRFVLSEFNTHRVFTRNSASSRAIPVERRLREYVEDPAYPLAWTSEQPGMQGGAELTGQDLADAQQLFTDVHNITTMLVSAYLEQHPDKPTRLHKSRINRLLEPMLWHRVLVTSTEWSNFFALRDSEFAEPEIALPAHLMRQAYEASVPEPLDLGEWHLPYITGEEIAAEVPATLKMISVARCARLSTVTQDGKRDRMADMALYDRLVTAKPMHASPLEHIATPTLRAHPEGNFRGWRQLRHQVEREMHS